LFIIQSAVYFFFLFQSSPAAFSTIIGMDIGRREIVQGGVAAAAVSPSSPTAMQAAIVKNVVFLRHGQSVYNAHKAEFGVDPMVRDAPLTAKGQEQALSAVAKLSLVTQSFGGLDGGVRVVSSPLSRALETAVLAWPEGAGRIDLWHEVRETISGCDDIGKPASQILRCPVAAKACGERLAEITARMPEIWWTVPAELTGVDGGEEMLEAFKNHKPLFTAEEERILDGRLRSILARLASTPEATVVIVAHGDLIASLTALLGLSETDENLAAVIRSGQFGSTPTSNLKKGWWLLNAEVRVAEGLDLKEYA